MKQTLTITDTYVKLDKKLGNIQSFFRRNKKKSDISKEMLNKTE